MSQIIFLGTGGARVLVFKQLLASGGLWMELGETRIHVDPGPGALVQATKRKLDPTKLDAIVLTHRHLDHCSDVNAMIEAMTTGGFHPRGLVLAPRDAFEEDPVILRYLRGYFTGMAYLEEGSLHQIGSVTLCTPLRHQHPGEVYGLLWEFNGLRLAHIVDSLYFPELAQAYVGADIAIIHTVLPEPRPPVQHLSIPDARMLIEAIRPKLAVLTHFGMNVWKARPWLVAEQLSQETGIKVMAARDGMRLDLDSYLPSSVASESAAAVESAAE